MAEQPRFKNFSNKDVTILDNNVARNLPSLNVMYKYINEANLANILDFDGAVPTPKKRYSGKPSPGFMPSATDYNQYHVEENTHVILDLPTAIAITTIEAINNYTQDTKNQIIAIFAGLGAITTPNIREIIFGCQAVILVETNTTDEIGNAIVIFHKF